MTPVPTLPPMSLGMVFDIGIRVMRRHVGTLLAIAVLFQGPAALLTSAAGSAFRDTMLDLFPELAAGQAVMSLPLSDAEAERLLSSAGLVLGAALLAGVLGSIAALAYTAVVGADHDGRAVGVGDASRVALRRAVVGLGMVVISSLIMAGLIAMTVGLILALLSVLPPDRGGGGLGVFAALVAVVALVAALVILTVRWSAALPVVALESVGPVASLARSWRLTSGHAWRTLGVVLGGGLASSVLSAIVAQLLGFVLVDLVAADLVLGPAPEIVVGVVAAVLVAPIAPAFVAVLYHDLRAREAASAPRGDAAPVGSPD